MRRGHGLGAAAIAGALVLAACGSSPDDPAAEGKLAVVTTTTQLTDFARIVGGDRVSVYAVLKANVDPHDYEPTPADLDAIARADVVVKNGVGLEKWFDSTIKSAGPKGRIVDASAGVSLRAGTEDEGSGADPHIWLDPRNAKVMVTDVAQAFEAADPAEAATFQKNLTDYTAQLDVLDASIASRVATLTDKKLVTNHDAFGYYADRYGLQIVGSVIPSFDTQTELSPGDINDLVATIKAQGVRAVFSESSLPPKTADAIASEAGVKVVAGDDALYGDTLGPPGSDGDTYLKMMTHDTREIVENLG